MTLPCLTQIDTISQLIEEDMLIWNQMLDLYHTDSLDNYIRKLTAKAGCWYAQQKEYRQKHLKRVFGKRDDKQAVQQEIIRDLNAIEKTGQH